MLMISAQYPFPEGCGLTVRIADMCRQLAETYELHFLVCNAGEKFHTVENKDLFRRVTFASPVTCQATNFLKKLLTKTYRRLNPPHFDEEAYISNDLLEKLTNLHSEYNFDACMIHTPVFARCLRAFPESVFKIVDAIDIWNQRYQDFNKVGQGQLLYHFRDQEREIELLRSADLVLAISWWDYDYMKKNNINPVYVPVSFTTNPLEPKLPIGCDLLYAGGHGPTNIDAINNFVREILPIIAQAIPKVKFKILGACEEIKKEFSSHDNVELLPFIEKISDAYRLADVVVIPLRIGSGLKIKVLESFSFGKPTVVSPAAAQGIRIENYAQENISIDSNVFAGEVIKALKSADYRKALSDSALALIRTQYNPELVYAELKDRLQSL